MKYLLTAFMFLMLISGVLALGENLPEQRTPALYDGDIGIEQVKTAFLNAIDTTFDVIDMRKAQIEASSMPDDQKAEGLRILSEIESAFVQLEEDIQGAETVEEIHQAVLDFKDALVSMQDELKLYYKGQAEWIRAESVVKLEEIKQSIEQFLKVAKIACPDNKGDIEQIEVKLVTFESQIQDIKDLAGTGATNIEIQAAVKAAVGTAKEIQVLVTKLYNECDALQ